MKEMLPNMAYHCVRRAQIIYDLAVQFEQQNEQWFLDFLDNLNQVSTDRYRDVKQVYPPFNN